MKTQSIIATKTPQPSAKGPAVDRQRRINAGWLRLFGANLNTAPPVKARRPKPTSYCKRKTAGIRGSFLFHPELLTGREPIRSKITIRIRSGAVQGRGTRSGGDGGTGEICPGGLGWSRFGFAKGEVPPILRAMNAWRQSRRGRAAGFFIPVLLVSLAVAAQAQTAEVDEMRNQRVREFTPRK